ncbi:MAG: hypothetical protein A3F74_10355 [Betaproteobacteria bacterium RIFCSPLOWO2_12_FULL_62_58]|nr:MAG: hypothetical protein A3F74_10355 [Betaproteobacteria bacterium RIFCSPLOWO2_12_FULL_62_58]
MLGSDRTPTLFVESHLDSLSKGGNFNGPADIIAGIAAIEAPQQLSMVPKATSRAWQSAEEIGNFHI